MEYFHADSVNQTYCKNKKICMNGLVKQCSKEKKTNFENVRTSTSQYENVIF